MLTCHTHTYIPHNSSSCLLYLTAREKSVQVNTEPPWSFIALQRPQCTTYTSYNELPTLPYHSYTPLAVPSCPSPYTTRGCTHDKCSTSGWPVQYVCDGWKGEKGLRTHKSKQTKQKCPILTEEGCNPHPLTSVISCLLSRASRVTLRSTERYLEMASENLPLVVD